MIYMSNIRNDKTQITIHGHNSRNSIGSPFRKINMASYSASQSVQLAHSMPHLNQQLQEQSSQFAFTLDYGISLLPFPAILLSISLLLMFGYIFGLCIAGCKRCIWVERPLSPDRMSFADRVHTKLTHHVFIVRLFIASMILTVLISGCMWIGDYQANVRSYYL